MILVLDTETTGLPANYKEPVSDVENWPRLVQIAWRTYENNGKEIDQAEYIIYPSDFDIPAEATALHGITTELARAQGITIESALLALDHDLLDADYIVAHNIAYDEKIIGAEFIRVGLSNTLETKDTICTMLTSVNFCAIPGKYGNKWPKLSELYQVLFAENIDGQHDAVVDCEAAARCFWELVEKGVIPLRIEKEIAINDDLRKELHLEDVKVVEMSDEETALSIDELNRTINDESDFDYSDDVTEPKDIDTAPVWSPEKLQSEILDAYTGQDQTRMTLFHAEQSLWEAQRELDEANYELRKSESYAACKNEQQRSDYLYGNNEEQTRLVGIARLDSLGAKLDFERAHDSVERVRMLLRIAELSAGLSNEHR
ncbi:MAG: 3'-5' exonuclease [Ilumatobacteraceae bacterium]|jgi:DNA polymerase III epsilon subunit-like protein|nr:3'-5' exonuclease [Ilumatobacteraceae bacterium]